MEGWKDKRIKGREEGRKDGIMMGRKEGRKEGRRTPSLGSDAYNIENGLLLALQKEHNFGRF
jgi:hypothetical protein